MIEFERQLSGVPEKYQANFSTLLQDPLFMSETDGTEQMITATDILHGKKDKIPFSAIASFFNVAKGTIHQHWKRSRRGMFPHGRPVTIPDEIRSLTFKHITQEFEQGCPVCYDTILDWLYCEHHLTVLPDTLRHLIRRTDASWRKL
jgi:hypothetical protein